MDTPVCPDHKMPMYRKTVPAGVSKSTGKPYDAFETWACDGKTDGQWCRYKPPTEKEQKELAQLEGLRQIYAVLVEIKELLKSQYLKD